MELWTVNSSLVPWIHEHYARHHAYRPWEGVQLLEITPEWVYGASDSEQLFYTSNNYAVRETLSAYSDGMGRSCADHVSVERGMLCVPLWKDDDAGPAGGYHPAAIVGLSLIARMDDYPLLDEDDYSERETDAWYDYLEDAFRWVDDGERENKEIEAHLARFIGYAWEHLTGYYSVGDIPSTDIERAHAITRMED